MNKKKKQQPFRGRPNDYGVSSYGCLDADFDNREITELEIRERFSAKRGSF